MLRPGQQSDGPRQRSRGVVVDVNKPHPNPERLAADRLGMHRNTSGVWQRDLQFQQRVVRLFVDEADQSSTLVEIVDQHSRPRRADMQAFERAGDANITSCRPWIVGVVSHFGVAARGALLALSAPTRRLRRRGARYNANA